MQKHNNNKGFTLIELLVISGLISVSAASLYGFYHITEDKRKAKTETQSLTTVIRDLDNFSSAHGDLTGISLANIQNYSQNFIPAIELRDIDSTSNSVQFQYENVNTRICNDFSGKMLSSDKNISITINGKALSNLSLEEISEACSSKNELNNIIVIYHQPKDSQNLTVINASVNPPPTPHVDIVVPLSPTPSPIPTVPAFIPSTATPIVYGITGSAPSYSVISPSGGPITVTQGSGSGSTSIPGWTAPGFTPAPPATSAGVDEIDQDVLPPIITTETRTVSCPTGYTGTITESRKKTYYQGSGNVTYTPWAAVSNSCVLEPPKNTWLEGLANECGVFSIRRNAVRYSTDDVSFLDSKYLLYTEGDKNFYPMVVNVVAVQSFANGWGGDPYLPYKREIVDGRKIRNYCITFLPSFIAYSAIVKNGSLSMAGRDTLTYSGQASMNGPTITTWAWSNSYSSQNN